MHCAAAAVYCILPAADCYCCCVLHTAAAYCILTAAAAAHHTPAAILHAAVLIAAAAISMLTYCILPAATFTMSCMSPLLLYVLYSSVV